MNSFIKSLMDERSLKQKELAAILGISSAAVSQWNEEGTNISIDCLFSLSKLFHVTVDELLNGKRIGESLEDKWKREYDINEETARNAMINHDKRLLLQCLDIVAKTNDRFFVLFERKIIGKISENELKEWVYIRRFYDVNIRRSHLFDEVMRLPIDNRDEFILNSLLKKYGAKNIESIIWEIRKVYKIEDFGIDQSILSDFEDDLLFGSDLDGNDIYYDADIFYAWYNILTPIEKDEIISAEFNGNKGKCQRMEYLYELIKRGGNILYTSSDLNLINYDYKDLNNFEGEIRPVPELDKAQSVIYEIYDNYSLATYEQYQALINFPRMRQVEMEAKYKGKNSIKYWEYIKNNEVLI